MRALVSLGFHANDREYLYISEAEAYGDYLGGKGDIGVYNDDAYERPATKPQEDPSQQLWRLVVISLFLVMLLTCLLASVGWNVALPVPARGLGC